MKVKAGTGSHQVLQCCAYRFEDDDVGADASGWLEGTA